LRNSFDPAPIETATLAQALSEINSGLHEASVCHVRQVLARHGKRAYDKAKAHLPAYTFGGTFAPKRGLDRLLPYSGLIHGDLDHLANVEATKRTICNDPRTAYGFKSPSGHGLKIGVHVHVVADDREYKRIWQAVSMGYAELYGVAWDISGKDVSRLCYASWDPQAYWNADATVACSLTRSIQRWVSLGPWLYAYGVYGLALLGTWGWVATDHRPVDAAQAGIIGLFAGLSVWHVRVVSDFALVTAPFLAASATRLLDRRGTSGRAVPPGRDDSRPAALGGGVVLLLGLVAYLTVDATSTMGRELIWQGVTPGFGPASDLPTCAVDFLHRHQVTGRAYVDMSRNGLLIHRTFPAIQPAVTLIEYTLTEGQFREWFTATHSPAHLQRYLM
jgi:hypothetical protein